MNCWHCNTKLIWGGDHDSEAEEWSMETNLSCPECNSWVMVYLPREGYEHEDIAEQEGKAIYSGSITSDTKEHD